MSYKYINEGIGIKSWCEDIEDGALKQAVNAANHPAAVGHIALMPDCHQGYGVPIGSVMACKDVVIPNAVGVDIGCGMVAAASEYNADCLTDEVITQIIDEIYSRVPVGFKHQKEPVMWGELEELHRPKRPVLNVQAERARYQLGTLGGGNHFVELQVETETRRLWLMVHSGSRNLGLKIANHYHELAKDLCSTWHSDLPHEDLAFLPLADGHAVDYLAEMNFALTFARHNRHLIMTAARGAVDDVLNEARDWKLAANIHHNYATKENHFKKNVVVHRKGATLAREGTVGIIPGDCGTSSYIVRGLGNRDSLTSCSHGAGRVMGRKEASRKLTVEECNEAMKGVVFRGWGKDRKGNVDLGEAPQAYKEIDSVIEAQSDLVEVMHKLKPIGSVKG
jgi:tRNA-splicing ligase RtcB (3'-phosphate/5'-hydroxy nucleic acid ligase)